MEKNKSSRILVGLWDCPYCGAKGLNGLKKHCPNCGHPQDEGTKFYLGEEKEYLDEETAKNYGQGADWTCAYCGALNRYNANFCEGCGASREESTGDYFENEKKQEEKEQRRQAEINAAAAPQQQTAPAAPQKKRSPALLLIVLAAIIGLFVFLFMPRNGNAAVAAKEWTRTVYTQVYEDVQRTDWSMPSDATLISSERAIHHYDQVLDHYEDVKVRRSRQVIDHYETYTYTVNNGDGTFTENSYDRPVYETEYYYETERQPVYVPVPVYAIRYTYTHKEWVDGEKLTVSGTEEEPYWPAFNETSTSRVATRYDAYRVTLSGEKNKTYIAMVNEDLFNGYKVGDTVDITVSTGTLTAINGVSLR